MFVCYSLTLPPGGSVTSLTSKEVEYPPGIVTRVKVTMPSGCAGLAHFRVRKALHQLWPYNPDSWFAEDDLREDFDEELDLSAAPHVLVLEGYNEDDTYPHTPVLKLVIMPPPPPGALTFEDLIRAQVAANAGVAM